jgi:hypothetical protein
MTEGFAAWLVEAVISLRTLSIGRQGISIAGWIIRAACYCGD